MSALFGFVRPHEPPDGPVLLARMGAALAGPFDVAGGLWAQGGTAMGTRHLPHRPDSGAIRVCPRSGLVFAADARIDNRAEVRAQLRAEGESPDGDDADLLLALWRRWDVAGLKRVAGVFAFAAWAPRTRRLVLARSPITAPPLHYQEEPDLFAFATMPRGILALPGQKRQLDRHTLALNLIRLPGADHVTLFTGIRRLPMGCLLVTEPERPARVERWWDVDFSRSPPTGTFADHAAALRDLIARVVEEQMPEHGPAGLLLSGGLDSTALAAFAARTRPPVLGFTHVPSTVATEVPSGWVADESPLVRDLAAACPGLESRLLPPETGYLLDGADAVVPVLERHFSNIGNLDWILTALCAARDSGAQVMLTGAQGNLTASRSGGAPFLAALAARDWPGVWGSFTPRRAASAAAQLLPDTLYRRLLALRGNVLAAKAQPWRDFFAIRPAFAAAQNIDGEADTWFASYLRRPQDDERPGLLQALQRQDTGSVDHALTHLTGVEWRHPLADRRVAEFCLHRPNRLFHQDGVPRALIREAVRGLVPESIRTSQTRGLQAADTLARVKTHPARLAAEFERLERCDLAREALDLGLMRACADDLLGGRAFPISVLVGGLTMGRFLCWAEEEGVR